MTESPRVTPSFYLNIGSSVVSAVKIFESPYPKGQPPSIISGDVGGNIKSWNSHTQRAEQTLTEHSDIDQSAAVLWLDSFSDEDGSSYLVVQRRFSTFVSTFKYNSLSPPHSRWVLATHLTLPLVDAHNAFCSGDVMYPYLVVPQGEKTMVLAQFDKNSCNKLASLATEPAKGNLTALRLVFVREGWRQLQRISSFLLIWTEILARKEKCRRKECRKLGYEKVTANW